jgi:CubicO group peptidase (beta-lactamase class C family)
MKYTLKTAWSYICLLCLLLSTNSIAQNLRTSIDALLEPKDHKPFNGVILVAKGLDTFYAQAKGYSNMTKRTPLQLNDQFIIGSVSKQITATIILMAYDRGELDLHTPIHKYLPHLKQSWADTITVHQLLTHTHGIKEHGVDQPLAFRPGTQCQYSNTGYQLLGEIAAGVAGKTFTDLSSELFRRCGMTRSFHPELKKHKHLVKSYSENSGGSIELASGGESLPAWIIPAGGFISTAEDLVKWNNQLHNGKLLKPATYKLMTTAHENAVRMHPIFGKILYGYGLAVGEAEPIKLGHSGQLIGFCSINFYYPTTRTSIIVLNNVQLIPGDIKKSFDYHVKIMDAVENSGIAKKN